MVLFYPFPIYFGIWEYRFNICLFSSLLSHWHDVISFNIIETGGLEFMH